MRIVVSHKSRLLNLRSTLALFCVSQMEEKPIPLKEIPSAYRRLAGLDRNPSLSVVRRWYSVGVRGGVTLSVMYRSGRVYTTSSKIRDFIIARDEEFLSRRRNKLKPVTPVVQNQSVQALVARLESMGA